MSLVEHFAVAIRRDDFNTHLTSESSSILLVRSLAEQLHKEFAYPGRAIALDIAYEMNQLPICPPLAQMRDILYRYDSKASENVRSDADEYAT